MSPAQNVQTHHGRRSRDRWRAKSRACLQFSLTSRGLFIKNSSLQAKQSFSHTTSTFYIDWVKMCEEFAPKFGDKRTGCCITTTHTHAMHTRGRGLFRGWVGPKLGSDQIAAPVPEIMNGTLWVVSWLFVEWKWRTALRATVKLDQYRKHWARAKCMKRRMEKLRYHRK
jgi:hypothetical protein